MRSRPTPWGPHETRNQRNPTLERTSYPSGRASPRACKKIAAGPRARCAIEKRPPGGNHRPMAFLVRIAAAKVIARTVWTASRRMFPRVDLPPDLRLVRHKGRYNCHQRSNASVSNTTGAVPPKTIAGSHSRSTRPRRLRGLWSGPIFTGRTLSLRVFLGMP